MLPVSPCEGLNAHTHAHFRAISGIKHTNAAQSVHTYQWLMKSIAKTSTGIMLTRGHMGRNTNAPTNANPTLTHTYTHTERKLHMHIRLLWTSGNGPEGYMGMCVCMRNILTLVNLIPSYCPDQCDFSTVCTRFIVNAFTIYFLTDLYLPNKLIEVICPR